MASLANGHSPNGNKLADGEGHLVDLGDEDARHGFVESCAVHVHGGADGQHKTSHTSVYSQRLLQASKTT